MTVVADLRPADLFLSHVNTNRKKVHVEINFTAFFFCCSRISPSKRQECLVQLSENTSEQMWREPFQRQIPTKLRFVTSQPVDLDSHLDFQL